MTKPPKLVPYVSPSERMPEFTVRAVALGALLSLTFGMVNAYLGLKVGLTVSASIPSAVISMAVLRGILRRGTVLENNIVHTIASTGESLAAGVVFTIPALIFLELAPTSFEVFLFGATAGVLGILMMIPLRRALTVERHGELPFPEGTACA
ncbi:MAG: OPT/YSL family transporter, partial [Candidatus Binatia bacterium]